MSVNLLMLCNPWTGWLVDQTEDYSTAFYFSGLCLVSSAVFVVLVDRLIQRRKVAEAEVHLNVPRDDWEPAAVM